MLAPAVSLYDEVPMMARQVSEHFSEMQVAFAWVSDLNEQLTALTGEDSGQQVVLAGPSMLEQLAFATPTVLLELLLTFMLAFFTRVCSKDDSQIEKVHAGVTVCPKGPRQKKTPIEQKLSKRQGLDNTRSQ